MRIETMFVRVLVRWRRFGLRLSLDDWMRFYGLSDRDRKRPPYLW